MNRSKSKVCKRCSVEKELSNVRKTEPRKENHNVHYSGNCKECIYQIDLIWKEENKEKVKEMHKESYARQKADSGRAKLFKEKHDLWSKTINGKYSEYKGGANKRDMQFDISLDEFSSFWQKPCSYCEDAIDTIGLDRINNDMGYTITNLKSCCSRCNTMKMDKSSNEFIAQISKIFHNLELK